MLQTLEPGIDACIRDNDELISRELFHGEPVVSAALTPRAAADAYLRSHAHLLALPGASGGAADTAGPYGLTFVSQLTLFDTSAVSYEQTYDGIPVWRCGAAVHLRTGPLRVTSARSTVRSDVRVRRPSPALVAWHLSAEPERVLETLGLTGRALAYADVNGADRSGAVLKRHLVVYRYDKQRRVRPAAQDAVRLTAAPHHLEHGADRVAVETTVKMGHGLRSLAWLVLTDVETRAVLYVEPFVDDVGPMRPSS